MGNIHEAFKPYLIVEIARFWLLRRDILPKTLQRFVKRLGYYVGWGHSFHRYVRRAYIALFPAFVVFFFVLRQVRLSAGESPGYALVEALIVLLAMMLLTMRIMFLVSREMID